VPRYASANAVTLTTPRAASCAPAVGAAGALLTLAARPEVDAARIAAIGFCFPMSLEPARSGAEIRAAVGFHTTLAAKAPAVDPGAIKARVLVCIGADDPFIPASSQGRGGSRSPLRVRPMEEGRKSSLSYRPAALPKPVVPSGCASIGIIAAPLSESLFVKRWS
jgi:hypothetical protein